MQNPPGQEHWTKLQLMNYSFDCDIAIMEKDPDFSKWFRAMVNRRKEFLGKLARFDVLAAGRGFYLNGCAAGKFST